VKKKSAGSEGKGERGEGEEKERRKVGKGEMEEKSSFKSK
jgi:hypothetical protein